MIFEIQNKKSKKAKLRIRIKISIIKKFSLI